MKQFFAIMNQDGKTLFQFDDGFHWSPIIDINDVDWFTEEELEPILSHLHNHKPVAIAIPKESMLNRFG